VERSLRERIDVILDFEVLQVLFLAHDLTDSVLVLDNGLVLHQLK
jgi:hypothetical protein